MSIALAVAEARSVDLVLQRIVDGLAGQPGIALARIWLIAPGDICASSCLVRAECPDQTRCLHLRASAGRSIHDSSEDWTRLTGGFRRIPLNVWKVGRIGGTGTPMLITDELATDPAIHRPEWALLPRPRSRRCAAARTERATFLRPQAAYPRRGPEDHRGPKHEQTGTSSRCGMEPGGRPGAAEGARVPACPFRPADGRRFRTESVILP